MAKAYALPGPVTVGLQANTERTVYAVWPASSWKKQDGYRIIWFYDTGQGVWFTGSDTSTSGTTATYSAPTNALQVMVQVGPKPNNKAKWVTAFSSAIYNSGWADKETHEVVDPKPAAPSTPTIEVKGTAIKATVANYSHAKSTGQIRIQIVVNDATVVNQGVGTARVGLAELTATGSLGGNRYKARAQAVGNSGVDSDWSGYSENKYTPPDKANITKLSTISKNSINVLWNKLTGADSYTVEYTSTVVDNIPVFDTGSSDVQTASGITATHFLASSLDWKKWYFRLKGVNTGGDGGWSSTKSIQLGTKPDKPSTWSFTSVGKIGTPIILNWVHSSEDGSEQSGAKVGIAINDGAETVINLTTESSYTFDTSSLSDSDIIRWRVQTRGTRNIFNEQGASIEWGDFSEYREIVVYSPPQVTFSVGYPDPQESLPVIYSFPIQIQGNSTPITQTPVAFYVSIVANEQYDISQADGLEVHVAAGEEIYSKYIPVTEHVLDLTINPGDIFLHKGTSYTVAVTIAMTNGLTGEASSVFMAIWDDPAWDPSGEVTIDKVNLCAYIRPFCADRWGFEYKKGFTLAVYRIDFDGNLTEIYSGIDASENSTVTDLHPSLDYARYRIVATDNKTGMVFYADLEGIPFLEKCAVIQWEGEVRANYIDPYDIDYMINTWSGSILKLPYNIDVSDDLSPDVALVEYIGRKHPVSYYGTQEGSTSRWSAEIPITDTSTIAKLRALAIYPGDVYVREPHGTGYWANVKVNYSFSYNKATVSANFTITRVEGGA